MPMTETIPTKFSKEDVSNMDLLIKKGIFISRSDLVRGATREKIEGVQKIKSEKDIFVRYMYKTGALEDLEGQVLAKLHLNSAFDEDSAVSRNKFSKSEVRAIERLMRHPMNPIKKTEGRYYLNENGKEAALGFIDAVLHFKKQGNKALHITS